MDINACLPEAYSSVWVWAWVPTSLGLTEQSVCVFLGVTFHTLLALCRAQPFAV